MPRDMIPPASAVFRPSSIVPIALPLIALIVVLFQGFTPMRAAFAATVLLIILHLVIGGPLSTIIERVRNILRGFAVGAQSLVMVAPLIACAQVIISLVTLTGVGVKISSLIMGFGGEFLPLALVLSMVVCMVLGLGLPTTGAYLLAAAVVARALVHLGIEPIAAHLFLFYFAILGMLTPPVCIACFVAAGIAETSWLRTAWFAIRFAAVGFIVPFLFVQDLSLLMRGEPLSIAVSFGTALVGVVALGAGLMGYLLRPTPLPQRLVLIGSGLVLLMPGIYSDIIGVVGFALILVWQRFGARTEKT